MMFGSGNIRRRHIFIAFFFGGLAGLVTQWAMLAIPTMAYDPTLSMIFLAVIVAPILEELAKPIGIYIIKGEEIPYFTLTEWAMLGCLAGFGFMILENILYGLQAPGDGFNGGWLMAARFLMPLHIVATGITGFGIGLWTKTRNAKYFVICISAAMLLHALHNLTLVLMEGSI